MEEIYSKMQVECTDEDSHLKQKSIEENQKKTEK